MNDRSETVERLEYVPRHQGDSCVPMFGASRYYVEDLQRMEVRT